MSGVNDFANGPTVCKFFQTGVDIAKVYLLQAGRKCREFPCETGTFKTTTTEFRIVFYDLALLLL